MEANVLLVQSFGRNSLQEADLWWIKKNIFKNSGSNDFLAIKELEKRKFDPGKPNYSLAAEARQIMDKYSHLCAIVQWEVAAAFDRTWYFENKHKIICLWPPEYAKHYTTWDVKKDALAIMKKNGWKNPIELAHKRQITRAYFIVRKLCQKELGSDNVIILSQKTSCFDKKSKQSWTKGPFRWFFYETLARIHHILRRMV
jgi:hypothetical protein